MNARTIQQLKSLHFMYVRYKPIKISANPLILQSKSKIAIPFFSRQPVEYGSHFHYRVIGNTKFTKFSTFDADKTLAYRACRKKMMTAPCKRRRKDSNIRRNVTPSIFHK